MTDPTDPTDLTDPADRTAPTGPAGTAPTVPTAPAGPTVLAGATGPTESPGGVGPAGLAGSGARRLEPAAWALLVAQVVHGLTPSGTDSEGYAGLVGGLILLIATLAAILGLRTGRPWARPLLHGTGLLVALGFVLYHATPVSSPVTNPYIGEGVGIAAWVTVVLSIAAGLWAAYEARPAAR